MKERTSDRKPAETLNEVVLVLYALHNITVFLS